MKKKIVILANSKKYNASCIVGKDIESGEWIRTIGFSPTKEVSLKEQCIGTCQSTVCCPLHCKEFEEPKFLDIVEIDFGNSTKVQKSCYQPENILISGAKWEKIGELSKDEIDKYTDNNIKELWNQDSSSSFYGHYDRILDKHTNESVYFIKVPNLRLHKGNNIYSGKDHIKGTIRLGTTEYILQVTEKKINELIERKDNYTDAYIVVSLAEPYEDNFRYKFIATIEE